MLSHVTRFPPATHVFRPERKDRPPGLLDRLSRAVTGGFQRARHARDGRMPGFVSRVEDHGRKLAGLKDEDLRRAAGLLRSRLHLEDLPIELAAEAFALVREASTRVLGMRHFDTQLVGGWVMLQGMVAEMETGEGKTLTATLAAGTAALAGIPVHVITVNDYLTGRDAESMGPVYGALGLRVGRIVHGMTPEARRAAYGCDVTYCTNKEVAFDYLRDWLALEGSVNPLRLQAEYLYGHEARVHRLLLRGLHYGIVDEADSVLIDEARTPLIISGAAGAEGKEERAFLDQAMGLARSLEPGMDYRIERASRKIELTDGGKARIRERASALGPLWTGSVRREEVVRIALTAIHLFRRDEEYLVKDGKVQIVDEFTGRVMPDRSYEGGLHQLIEIKEGCETTRRPQTMARISYQRFFRRYLHLAGMTGTAREVRAELWSVYGLPVVRVPTCREMRRRSHPDRIFQTEREKWRAVGERVREMCERGRPVLIGTRSVAASEKAARLLTEMGLPHQVLNAKQDREEAEIISRAGELGGITIATNMAGRGTDIRLGPGVEDRGGLHVILTERHEAARIDRQLAGRCGRLGDPGTFEALLSMEDSILKSRGAGFCGWMAAHLPGFRSSIWTWLAKRGILNAQKRVERLHFRIRKGLLREDERRGDMLSFSGPSE